MNFYYFFTWERITPFGKVVYSDVCKVHPFIEINKIRERLGKGVALLSYKEISEYEYNLFDLELKEQKELSDRHEKEFRRNFSDFNRGEIMLLNDIE